MTSEDPVKECRDKCQPMKDHVRSTNFAMYFWLSNDKSECYCLPDYPLGGNWIPQYILFPYVFLTLKEISKQLG